MKTRVRLIVYLATALTLLAVAIAAPGAWAEPLQNRLGQTVPTATRPGDVPTQRPSNTPVPRDEDTPVPPTDVTPDTTAEGTETVGPSGAEEGTATPEAGVSPLALVKEVSSAHIWPGASIVFTLTLTNTSTGSVRQVRLEDVLPEGLTPGAIQGTDATWSGRTLSAQRAVLPPGGRLAVVFVARVADEVPAGGVIVNQVVATAGAGTRPTVRITASALMMLPPLELPPTGASLAAAEAAR